MRTDKKKRLKLFTLQSRCLRVCVRARAFCAKAENTKDEINAWSFQINIYRALLLLRRK